MPCFWLYKSPDTLYSQGTADARMAAAAPGQPGAYPVAAVEVHGAGAHHFHDVFGAGQIGGIQAAVNSGREYGLLHGIVGRIAKVPSDSGYFALVLLPDTLKTQSGSHIPYREGMIAEERVITKGRRLIVRFYDEVTMFFEC